VDTGMILVNNQLDAQFLMYVYFYSLHVSGSHVPIIRSINVSMRYPVYVTLCRWPSGVHTRRSSTQRNYGKSHKTLVKKVGVPAKIRTWNLENASQYSLSVLEIM